MNLKKLFSVLFVVVHCLIGQLLVAQETLSSSEALTLEDSFPNPSETATSSISVPDFPQFLPNGEPLVMKTISTNVQTISKPSVFTGTSKAFSSFAVGQNSLSETSWESVFSLNFNSPVPGTIQDINGFGTGFTQRLPGTGWGIPFNDPYSNLLVNPGCLTISATRFHMYFGWPYPENWPITHPEIGDTLGTKVEGIGTQPFRIVTLFRNVQNWQQSDQICVYLFADPGHGMRSVLHQSGVDGGRDYLFTLEQGGYHTNFPSAGGTYNTGDDIRMTITRLGNYYTVMNEDLTTGMTSIGNYETNFMDFANDLYFGVFYSIPWDFELPKVAQLDYFEIFRLPAEKVIEVITIPDTLWVDKTGAGSGIVFRATTAGPTAVNFIVRTPSGPEFAVGSKPTSQVETEHVAKLSWWGQLPDGSFAEPGTYTVIAEAGGTTKEVGFTVKQTDADIAGLDTWMKDSKDPAAVLPQSVWMRKCPTCPWEQMLDLAPGYFTTLSVSDPVNIVSGNLVWPEVDFSLKSRLPITFARIYNSLDPHVGPLGRGWSSPFFSRLEILASDVIFVNSDGSRVRFKKLH